MHDVIDVFVIIKESALPISPFTHVPFPNKLDNKEKEHPFIAVVVRDELDPPSIFTIDALILA